MLAFYRLRCDHSFLIWPRSLTAVHNTNDTPMDPPPPHGTFQYYSVQCAALTGSTQGEPGVARAA